MVPNAKLAKRLRVLLLKLSILLLVNYEIKKCRYNKDIRIKERLLPYQTIYLQRGASELSGSEKLQTSSLTVLGSVQTTPFLLTSVFDASKLPAHIASFLYKNEEKTSVFVRLP